MNVIVNGEEREVQEEATINCLLAELDLLNRPVLVEYNGTALFPRDFKGTKLKSEDRIELIRVVAGG